MLIKTVLNQSENFKGEPHPIWYESERGLVIPVRNESERDRIVHNIGHGDQYGRGEAQNADASRRVFERNREPVLCGQGGTIPLCSAHPDAVWV